ncbi:MAG: GtrA family protein [Xanthomonadales bacterium]|nr:GtrA family protein [Xanthomonadales bacterium]
MRRLFRFAVSGTAGFLVDASLLALLVTGLDLNPYLARIPSFLSAVTTTWLINRYWTFADRRGRHAAGAEWRRYLLAMSGGAAVNYGVYALLLATVAQVAARPVLGVAAGSLAAMVVNFASSSRWIFPAKSPSSAAVATAPATTGSSSATGTVGVSAEAASTAKDAADRPPRSSFETSR